MNEADIKQRLIGAVVLIALGVIFIPILLNGESDDSMPIFGSNIPARHQSITNMKPLDMSSIEPQLLEHPIEIISVDELSPELPKQQLLESNKELPDQQPSKIVQKEALELAAPKVTQYTANAWVVQVGSFIKKKNAMSLRNILRQRKFDAFVEAIKTQTDLSYRVRVGPEVVKLSAEKIQKEIKKIMRINGIVVQHKE